MPHTAAGRGGWARDHLTFAIRVPHERAGPIQGKGKGVRASSDSCSRRVLIGSLGSPRRKKRDEQHRAQGLCRSSQGPRVHLLQASEHASDVEKTTATKTSLSQRFGGVLSRTARRSGQDVRAAGRRGSLRRQTANERRTGREARGRGRRGAKCEG